MSLDTRHALAADMDIAVLDPHTDFAVTANLLSLPRQIGISVHDRAGPHTMHGNGCISTSAHRIFDHSISEEV